jgi:hypothetical protein
MPPETDDRDEVPAGPEAELVGLGGKMGFRVDDVKELPAGPDEAGEVPAGPDTLLGGEGGRIGFGDEVPIGSAVADEAGEVPTGTDGAEEADEKLGMLPVEEEDKTGPEDEPPTGPYVAVMRVVDEEVRVTGQTVVETAMTMVLTGQSLMPALQL